MSILRFVANRVNSRSESGVFTQSDLPHTSAAPIGFNADVDESWQTEPGYRCGAAKKVFRRGSEYVFVPLRCDRWDCPTCGPRLAAEWAQRCAAVIEEKARQGAQFWFVIGDSERWGAIYKSLQRKEASYVRFMQGDGRVRVITTAPPDTKGVVATPVAPGTAVALAKKLATWAHTDGSGKKRITASRDWKIEEEPERRGLGGWEELDVVIVAPWEKIQELVEEFGGESYIIDPGRRNERLWATFPWGRDALQLAELGRAFAEKLEELGRTLLEYRHAQFANALRGLDEASAA